MYTQVQINLYLRYFYMQALVQQEWIRSRVDETFPAILDMPWFDGDAIYGALAALNNT